jgi:hypothetical protein
MDPWSKYLVYRSVSSGWRYSLQRDYGVIEGYVSRIRQGVNRPKLQFIHFVHSEPDIMVLSSELPVEHVVIALGTLLCHYSYIYPVPRGLDYYVHCEECARVQPLIYGIGNIQYRILGIEHIVGVQGIGQCLHIVILVSEQILQK